jgi:hypothetical protein
MSIRATRTRQSSTQQRRPLHPIPLASPRDGSSFHLGWAKGNFSCSDQTRDHSARRAGEDSLGNYSDGPGRYRISAMVLSEQAAGCCAHQRPRSALRVDRAPDCTTLCRQEGPASFLSAGNFVYSDVSMKARCRAPRPTSNITCRRQTSSTRNTSGLNSSPSCRGTRNVAPRACPSALSHSEDS